MREEILLEIRRKAESDPSIKISRWATNEEVKILADCVAKLKIPIVLECGTANGWSTMWMASVLPPHGELTTFDIVMRPWVFLGTEFERNINFVLGSFSENVSTVCDRYKDQNKFFFIDGLHTYRGVREDFEAVKKNTMSGDIIMFHDTIGEVGVARLMPEIREEFPFWENIKYSTRNGMEKFKVI